MYIYIKWSFNKNGEILPKELVIGSTVYSCNLFKEISSDSLLGHEKTYHHDL